MGHPTPVGVGMAITAGSDRLGAPFNYGLVTFFLATIVGPVSLAVRFSEVLGLSGGISILMQFAVFGLSILASVTIVADGMRNEDAVIAMLDTGTTPNFTARDREIITACLQT